MVLRLFLSSYLFLSCISFSSFTDKGIVTDFSKDWTWSSDSEAGSLVIDRVGCRIVEILILLKKVVQSMK